jgi:hypothetical protein
MTKGITLTVFVNDSNEEGSEYSDTDDGKARKMERKAMLAKRKKGKRKLAQRPR